MNLRAELERRLAAAMAAAGAPAGSPAMVAPAGRPEFGDYQANGVMAVAKAIKTNPRKLAELVVAKADVSDLAEPLEVAGPGFINIRLKPAWLARRVGELLSDDRLGTPRPSPAQRVVVDYSSPNLAKEMHVGHLRSTIIGDALARTLEFIGHDVIRQNHVGDWGTMFGMLVAHLEQRDQAGEIDKLELSDLDEFYRQASARFGADPDFADRARQAVVRMQSGDAGVLAKWRQFRQVSLDHAREVYQRLGVSLTDADIHGESDFNDDLPRVIADLRGLGMLRQSQGAQCVFLDQFIGKDGEPLPVIVQKSDGGYLYATTDLAAVRYRVRVLRAGRILIATDSRQSLHLQQVFAVARKAGWAPPEVSLEHVAFGTMMGPDHKPFKTRSGEIVKLMDLLDEAELRAYELVSQKSPELSEDRRRGIARTVGVGAVKYADLSQHRASDYVFSWEKMLSLEGNTAPYMQYAYARVRSIFRKGLERSAAAGQPAGAGAAEGSMASLVVGAAAVQVAEPAERLLALRLGQFAETLEAVAADSTPHLLCGYLYELAGAFMGFYESCPVLQSAEPLRSSRLALCELTARTIRTGLGLLGIDVIEQM